MKLIRLIIFLLTLTALPLFFNTSLDEISLPTADQLKSGSLSFKISPYSLYSKENPIFTDKVKTDFYLDDGYFFWDRKIENLEFLLGLKTDFDAASERIKMLEFAVNGRYGLSLSEFNYLEQLLSEYEMHILRELENLTRLDTDQGFKKVRQIYFQLQNHHLQVNRIIFRLNETANNKQKLFLAGDRIFSGLSKYINLEFNPNTTNTVNYNLESLVKAKEYGLFDILVKNNETHPYSNNIGILHSSKHFTPANDSDPSANQEFGDYYIFPKLEVNSHTNRLSLTFKEIDLTENYDWKENRVENTYEYEKTFPLLFSDTDYLFKTEFQTDVPVTIRLDYLKSKKRLVWNEFILSPFSLIPIETNILHYNLDGKGNLSLKIISQSRLSAEQLSAFRIKLTPVINPQLVFNKNQYLPDKSQTFTVTRKNPLLYSLSVTNYSDAYLNEISSRFADLPLWNLGSNKKDTTIIAIDFLNLRGLFFLLLSLIIFTFGLMVLPDILGNNIFSLKLKKYRIILINLPISFLKKTYVWLIFQAKKLFSVILFLISEIRKYRLTLLIFSLVAIKLILSHESFIGDEVIMLTVCIWFVAALSYEMQSNISFTIALIFLFFIPGSLAVKDKSGAEILATWSYLFLISGSFIMILEKFIPTYKGSSLLQVLRDLVIDLNKSVLIKPLKQTLVEIALLGKNTSVNNFKINPDLVKRIIRIVVYLFFFSSITFFLFHIYGLYDKYIRFLPEIERIDTFKPKQ